MPSTPGPGTAGGPGLPVDTGRLTDAAGPVLDALGRAGSAALVPTPALLCDVDALEANLADLAGAARARGVDLRPHAKTHKSAFVTNRQLAHGAVGISCASVSEAAAIVERVAGLSVLVTSPVVGPAVARRAAALARRCDLLVAVDHPDGVDELGATGARIGVVCDVDVGLGRTGVADVESAREVVARTTHHPDLWFAGVQGYAGHAQHVTGRDARAASTRAANRRLTRVVEALDADGTTVGLRTGGGTGSSGTDLEDGVLGELQPGSYVFMDAEYRNALGDDHEARFAQSLTIATTVVSANQPGFVTVDAGLKAMATEAGSPTVVGVPGDVTYTFFGDEHGLVTRGATTVLARGDRLALVPPHCDPTVDRYDVLWLVRGDAVVGVADVDARSCSQ